MTGVGSDSWTPDSPANQVICQIPGEATLKSDNLEALLAFYDGLDSVERKQRFVSVLLERLDQNKGYRSVSYFIVCVLLKIGHLSQALEKARRDLKVGDDKAFGFSNVMMLLNGLLKYRHPDFSNEMLDEIERAIHNVEEHPFLIPAKVSAIRARRLTRPTESTATPTA